MLAEYRDSILEKDHDLINVYDPLCRENNESLLQVENTWADTQTDVTTVTQDNHRHREERSTLQVEADQEGASHHTDILAVVGSSEDVEGV